MPIIQKDKIKMHWNPANKKHFVLKGYTFTKMGDEFEIDYHDLSECSHVEVLCSCDFCGAETMKPYFKTFQDKVACKACRSKLTEYRLMKQYGVRNPAQIPYVQEKIKKTNLERYGCENVFGAEVIKKKIKETNLDKYGAENPMQVESIRERAAKTNLERYGAENVFASEEIKEKISNTCMERFGAPYATQVKEVQRKMRETKRKNYTTPASKQQIHYHELFGGELEYPVSYYALDIAFLDKMIYVECDFGGHFAFAKYSGRNEVETIFFDAQRDSHMLSKGWRVIRYMTRIDKYPNDDDMILLNSRLIKILQSSDISRILVDLDNRVVRFEPSFLFKSIDNFLKRHF